MLDIPAIAPLLHLYFYYITPGSFKSNNKRNISPLKRYFAGKQSMHGSGRGATAIGVAPLKITYKGQLNKERRPFCCVEKTFSLSGKEPLTHPKINAMPAELLM